MKKFKFVSLLLCLSLLMQSVTLTAAAAELPAESVSAENPAEMIPAATEPAFGEVCVKNGCRTVEGMVPLAGSDRKVDTAQAAFLYEINTQTVVYSLNPDMPQAPGNLTKLVNAVVTLQLRNLDDQIVTTKDVYRLPSGAHNVGLRPEEELTIRDVVHAMILFSSNDAAIAAAVAASGTQQAHTTRMNQWVESIGCTGTKFTNVHGLDTSECTTTARDMVKIYLAAIKNEDIKKILGTSSYTIPPTNKNPGPEGKGVSFRTHNYMLDNGIVPQFMDDRVVGGMQSNNNAYGASAAIMFQSKSGDLQYIGVVLNAVRTSVPDKEWVVIRYGNFEEMTDLLKMGFNSFKNKRILYNGQAVSQFTVAGGECDAVGEVEVDVDSVVPIAAQMDNLIMNFKVVGGNLSAPVKKGDMIATMQIEYRGSVMAEAEVYAMGNVTKAGDNGITIQSAAPKKASGGSNVMSTIGTICVIVLGLASAYLAFNAYMRNRIRARRRKRRAGRRRNY